VLHLLHPATLPALSRNPQKRTVEATVKELSEKGYSARQIAAELGIHHSTAARLVKQIDGNGAFVGVVTNKH
jgi:transposase